MRQGTEPHERLEAQAGWRTQSGCFDWPALPTVVILMASPLLGGEARGRYLL